MQIKVTQTSPLKALQPERIPDYLLVSVHSLWVTSKLSAGEQFCEFVSSEVDDIDAGFLVSIQTGAELNTIIDEAVKKDNSEFGEA